MKDKKKYDEIWHDDMPNMDDNLLWNQIEEALDKKKDKKRKMIWFFPFLLIGIIGFSMILIDNKQNKPSIINDKKTHTFVNTEPLKFRNPNLKLNTKDLKNILNANKTNLNQTAIATKRTINKERIQTPTNKYIINRSTQVIKNNPNCNSNDIINPNEDYAFLKPKNIKKGREQKKKRSYNNSNNKFENNGKDRSKKHTLININSLPISLGILTHDKENFLHEKQLLLSSYIKPENTFNKKASIIALSSFGYVFSKNKYNVKSTWQNRKNAKENTLYSFSYELLLSKPIYKNLFLSSGINYQQSITNYTDRDSSITNIGIIPSDSAFVIPSNNPIYLAGNKTKTTIKYRNLDTYTKISHWSIPLNIGLNINLTKQSKLILSTGVLLRFNTHITGYTNTPSNTISRYKDINTLLKTHLGISQVNVSTIYTRNISSKFNLLIGLNSILPIKPDYTILQSKMDRFEEVNYHLNMVLGIKYNL